MKPKGLRTILPAFLILFAGCSESGLQFPVQPPDVASRRVVNEVRQIEIGSEKYDADYGTISVPENRNRAGSRLINIPYLRIRSRSENPEEPVFGFAGGPGISNMSWSWGKAGVFLPEHDFVLVGYRGVDGSIVLDCPEVTRAFGEADNLLDDESITKIGHAWNAGANRLIAQGIDLDGYTMLETIEDNESVRTTLGYERINLLGESYGTRVAYLYALKHPGSIHRSAMIAVNPPGHFVWEPEAIDRLLRRYSMLWSRDSIMSLKSPDLYATMGAVLANLPRSWLFFHIDPGRVRLATFALLFHRNTAAVVFDAYVAAGRGDNSGLALMSLVYDYVAPAQVWGDLASKATSADFDSSRDYRRDLAPRGMPLGSPMNVLWAHMPTAAWPTRQLPLEFRTLRQSDVPTLLLSGSVDASTPAEAATDELLPCLTNGRQIIIAECGHVNDVWYLNAKNTRQILTSFFRSGVPDASLNSYVPMDFSVSWGFPTLAKTAIGVAALLLVALAALALHIARKYRRSKQRRGPRSVAVPADSSA